MPETPSVLIVDDGELDRAVRILEGLGVHPAFVRGSDLRGQPVEKPRDLLLLAWNATRGIPPLRDNPEGCEPTKVCLHSQDFLPLRERLREAGMDYLVQTSLDDDSLKRFLQTLLHRGPERRAERRLPLGGGVRLRVAGKTESCTLLDLSQQSCRLHLSRALRLDREVSVMLPMSHGGSSELELLGRVARCEPQQASAEAPGWSVLIRFEAVSDRVQEQLARILRGEQIGTRTTPLQAPAPPAQPACGVPERREVRHRTAYGRRVVLLEVEGTSYQGLGLGRDLSSSGVCITGGPILPVGTKVTVALYGDTRSEPVVVDATVVRVAEDEMGLQMDPLDAEQQREIEALQGSPSRIENLQAEGSARRIVSRVVATRR